MRLLGSPFPFFFLLPKRLASKNQCPRRRTEKLLMSLLFLAMSFVASEVGILMWLCPIKGTGLVWFYFPSSMCHVSQESGQMNRNRPMASPPSPLCHYVSSDLPGPTLRVGGGKKRTERAGSSLTS